MTPPSPTPADLVFRIAQLKDEFQHIADQHDWVCLAVPEPGAGHIVMAGEQSPNFIIHSHGMTGVDVPEDPARRAVADHVNHLTAQAAHLLDCLLEHGSQIPGDIRQEIREWEQRDLGNHYGWVRWVWHSTPLRNVRRIEHYPQVAVTALLALKQCCLPAVESADAPKRLKLLEGKVRGSLAELKFQKEGGASTDGWLWRLEGLRGEASLIPLPGSRPVPGPITYLPTMADVRAAYKVLLDWVSEAIAGGPGGTPGASMGNGGNAEKPTRGKDGLQEPCPPDPTAILARIPDISSATDIARLLGYPEHKKSLNTCLSRYRLTHPDCATEIANKKPTESCQHYRAAEVVGVIVKWIERLRTR
jgi:hypothetical protein